MTGTSDNSGKTSQHNPLPTNLLNSIVTDMIAVLTKPADFFQNMPKEGGFVPPLIFMVAMALITAVIMVLMGLIGLGPAGKMAMGLIGIIIFPIITAIFGFVGAAILFVIWKLMGSQENFETAYRCMAYSYAYAPVSAVLNIIPYLGTLIAAFLPMALLALASIHVHGRSQNSSWAVFGILGLILAVITFGAEKAGREIQNNADVWQQQIEQGLNKSGEEMTPEEAGKAMGEFLKGLKQSQEKE
ncbi:MAG: YIP1 family protein [Proteobacteria bacterium]|nr:YIP1 family protein [Pseudomonadota bacterium]MBU1715895.1 YIP1 family protein [Pseudomonadota bacterium]